MRSLPPNPRGDRLRLRVGLLGGSFNPAHAGHRHISLCALRALKLDEIWWLVSPQNPLKPVHGMEPQDLRLEAAAKVAAHPSIRVTGIESVLGTRFTADTLTALRQHFPFRRFVWLMGADNLSQMPRWNHWQRIFESVPVAVFDRSPYSHSVLAGLAARRFEQARRPARRAGQVVEATPPAWVFLHQQRHPASATAIRRQGLSPFAELH